MRNILTDVGQIFHYIIELHGIFLTYVAFPAVGKRCPKKENRDLHGSLETGNEEHGI